MNTITIELSAEDRALLNQIVERLDAQIDLMRFIIDNGGIAAPAENDSIKKAITEALAKATPVLNENTPKVEQDATKAPEQPTTAPIPEKATEQEKTKPTEATKAVTRAELGTKVRELMTKGFKEETKAIVKEYAPTVPGVPDDKIAECYAKLVALEG